MNQEKDTIIFNKYGDNDELRCDVCGMLYSEFLKTGVFGCPNCYNVFKRNTIRIIKEKITGSNTEKQKTFNKVTNGKIKGNPQVKKSNLKNTEKEVHKLVKELESLLSMYEERGELEKAERIRQEIEKLKNSEIDKK